MRAELELLARLPICKIDPLPIASREKKRIDRFQLKKKRCKRKKVRK